MSAKKLDRKELRKRINEIKSQEGLDLAHNSEDDLLYELIEQFCPTWVITSLSNL